MGKTMRKTTLLIDEDTTALTISALINKNGEQYLGSCAFSLEKDTKVLIVPMVDNETGDE